MAFLLAIMFMISEINIVASDNRIIDIKNNFYL